MAKAVRIPTAPNRDTRDVQLTLTDFEARVIKFICARIGGTPGLGTPRGAMDTIATALYDAGVVTSDDFQTTESRAIHFK